MNNTKIQGIIVDKLAYREKDLIAKVLLRSGHKISVLFYGARSMGLSAATKRTTRSTLPIELGLCLNVVLNPKRQKVIDDGGDLYSAKEWSYHWSHRHIRLHHSAYLLMCFYLEIMQKISMPSHLDFSHGYGPMHVHEQNEHYEDYAGLYRVLSNGIFYLEKLVTTQTPKQTEKQKSLNEIIFIHLAVFLMKLIYELGFPPQLHHCVFCKEEFFKLQSKTLIIHSRGGFACEVCFQREKHTLDWNDYAKTGSVLFSLFHQVKNLPYSKLENEIENLIKMEFISIEDLMNYLRTHASLEISKIKSYTYLSQLK